MEKLNMNMIMKKKKKNNNNNNKRNGILKLRAAEEDKWEN
jgi:hypothetical protein